MFWKKKDVVKTNRTALEVAEYVIYLNTLEGEKGVNEKYDSFRRDYKYSLSSLKLNRILFYCFGFHFILAGKDKYLFKDNFDITTMGFSVSNVRGHFSGYGHSNVKLIGIKEKKFDLTDIEKQSIEQVFHSLKGFTGGQIATFNLNEELWNRKWGMNERVTHDEIRDHFIEKYG